MDSLPWDILLNRQVAEDIRQSAKSNHTVDLASETARGLVDMFGPLEEVIHHACRQIALRLNSEPLGLSAKRHLPHGWSHNEYVLHVLSLMQWAVSEGQLELSNYWQSDDELSVTLTGMKRWNPAYVVALLENPERPEQADEEVFLSAEDIDNCKNPEDAAAYLLESLEIAARNGWLDGRGDS